LTGAEINPVGVDHGAIFFRFNHGRRGKCCHRCASTSESTYGSGAFGNRGKLVEHRKILNSGLVTLIVKQTVAGETK
jgi:hypothetical protein